MYKYIHKFSLLLFALILATCDSYALEVHQMKTAKGISVWFAPDKSVPVVSMNFSFENAGSAHAPSEKDGLNGITSEMMLHGAGLLDAKELMDKLAELSVRIGFYSDKDYFRGSFQTTLRTKEQGLALLKDVIYTPKLPEDRLAMVKKQAIVMLQNSLNSPMYLASRLAAKGLYQDHPYGRPALGTVDSINDISVDDMRKFLKAKLSKANLKVAVCGNLSKDEVIKMVDYIFADLPDKTDATEINNASVDYSGRIEVQEENFPQSNCLFYHPGLDYSDENYLALAIITKIFGGDFSSRLTQEIREKNGLAYTVQSSIANNKKSQHIAGYFGTENAKVEEAIDLVKKEFNTLATFGITAAELRDAKRSAIGEYVLRLSSTASIAAQMLFYQEINYPASYINERAGLIRLLNLDKMNAFIKEFFDPNKLTFFVVGKPGKDITN